MTEQLPSYGLPFIHFSVLQCHTHFRFRERYWRESIFEGIELVQKALDSVYGEGQVSLLRATLRWMCHHSKLSPKGSVMVLCFYIFELIVISAEYVIQYTQQYLHPIVTGFPSCCCLCLYLLCMFVDGVVLGASCMEHIIANVDACEEGPLDPSKIEISIALVNKFSYCCFTKLFSQSKIFSVLGIVIVLPKKISNLVIIIILLSLFRSRYSLLFQFQFLLKIFYPNQLSQLQY